MAELSRAIARLMEERSQSRAPSTDEPKLRDVLDVVRSNTAAAERPLAESFARHFLDHAGAEFLASGGVHNVAAQALSALRFLREAGTGKADEPRLAIFDPDLARDGWEAPATIVQTALRDRPFIVGTVQEALRAAGCVIRRLLHPVFAVKRDPSGAILAIAPAEGRGSQESLVVAELERVPDPSRVSAAIEEALHALVSVTDDYTAMRARAAELAEQLRIGDLATPWDMESAEAAALLNWLGEKNFVFLGYREYRFAGQGAERTAVVRPRSGLGLLRAEAKSRYANPRVLPDLLRRRLNEPPLLLFCKTSAESPVHRRAPMDCLVIKEVDAVGSVVGEHRFLGLLTAKAYAEDPAVVPVAREKLAGVLELEKALPESHDERQISATFASFPKVELLGASTADLHAEVRAVRAAEEVTTGAGDDVVVLERSDSLGQGVFVVVLVSRERFSDELYRQTEARLAQALSATGLLEQRLVVEPEAALARMHFYFAVPAEKRVPASAAELRARIAALLRTWDDRLREELESQLRRDEAHALAQRYGPAFSPHYKAVTDVPSAARDIGFLESLARNRRSQATIFNSDFDRRYTAVKLYLADVELVLSDFLPVLEHLGLRVFAEEAVPVDLPEAGRVRLHTFYVLDAAGRRLAVDRVSAVLAPALVLLQAGQIESDPLNSLIVTAEMDWRGVDLLRAYVNHGVQIRIAPSRSAVVDAVARHPRSARLLWEYFVAKFDPQRADAPAQRTAKILPEIERDFLASLEEVEVATEDRTLRSLFAAVSATVRTNFFTGAGAGDRPGNPGPEAEPGVRPALAIKMECARITAMPQPRPLFEIYVHSPQLEGVHLRASRVARGGIRLSDRPDDFRTEILDLMRTQTVKNAVIVPAGAKGGFVVKRPAGGPAGTAQAQAAYRTFIGALLSVTDNLVKARVQTPPCVLAYDEPDPYLVVAADKGTATFSDAANEIALAGQFWLGDAFASGGSQGYDHKKHGITARGAWECVCRHFRELGRDADREPLSVVGIGDMGGDVFGNGLLRSRRFLLRAAFNHQHVFLDPNPDPALSYTERERLFRLPRSTWADYNPQVIGPGGGIYPRAAKKIALSPEARQMLGIDDAEPSGEDVVRAVLRMEADLLWNGGIGTYVKANDEPHAAVGDSANDGVRVNGGELRVRVVAEGGNLGFTQRGRVEYAMRGGPEGRGGHINTDAVDNSGGVDMSDHEVNLKIALAGSGPMRPAERRQVLIAVADEVTESVLAHNRRQARVLGLDALRSRTHLKDFLDLMNQLEAGGALDRHAAQLPDREALRQRRGAYLGLTRPELAVLLAHAKLDLQHRLLASTLPEDPFLEPYLRSYFPQSVDARYGLGVRSHRLRREIVAVQVANALLDSMGAAAVARIANATGADPCSIVRAWAVAVELGAADDVREEVTGADPPLPAVAEERCVEILVAAVERTVKWILETHPPDASAGSIHQALAATVGALRQQLPGILPAAAQAGRTAAIEALASAGVPRALAESVVDLNFLAEFCEIAHIAAELEVPREQAAAAHYGGAEWIDLAWLHRELARLPADDRWERRAVEGSKAELLYAHRQLTRDILAHGGNAAESLHSYAQANEARVSRVRAIVEDVKSAPQPSLAALIVVVREFQRLVAEQS